MRPAPSPSTMMIVGSSAKGAKGGQRLGRDRDHEVPNAIQIQQSTISNAPSSLLSSWCGGRSLCHEDGEGPSDPKSTSSFNQTLHSIQVASSKLQEARKMAIVSPAPSEHTSRHPICGRSRTGSDVPLCRENAVKLPYLWCSKKAATLPPQSVPSAKSH